MAAKPSQPVPQKDREVQLEELRLARDDQAGKYRFFQTLAVGASGAGCLAVCIPIANAFAPHSTVNVTITLATTVTFAVTTGLSAMTAAHNRSRALTAEQRAGELAGGLNVAQTRIAGLESDLEGVRADNDRLRASLEALK